MARATWTLVSILLFACGSDDKSDSAGSGQTTGATTTGDTSTSTSGASNTTGGPLRHCQEAMSMEVCNAPGNDLLVCGWDETQVYTIDETGQCVLLETRGICTDDYSDDVTCGNDIPPTCAEEHWIFYRPLDGEDGVEIIEYNALASCGGSPDNGFVLCDVQPGTPPIYDPPECACACP